MKTFQVAAFADDGALQDLEAARLFARKLGTEDRLDFARPFLPESLARVVAAG